MDTIKNLLGSPRFWAAFLGLAFILVKAFIPTLPLNEEEVTGAVIALIAFIVSVSVQGAPTVWADLFKQWKFWALLVSLAFVFIRAFAPAFPLSEDQILAIISIFAGSSVATAYRPINTSR